MRGKPLRSELPVSFMAPSPTPYHPPTRGRVTKSEVLADEEAMRNMSHLGQTIAWLGMAMASVPDTTPFPKLAVELH